MPFNSPIISLEHNISLHICRYFCHFPTTHSFKALSSWYLSRLYPSLFLRLFLPSFDLCCISPLTILISEDVFVLVRHLRRSMPTDPSAGFIILVKGSVFFFFFLKRRAHSAVSIFATYNLACLNVDLYEIVFCIYIRNISDIVAIVSL